jgi:hypothetical protein
LSYAADQALDLEVYWHRPLTVSDMNTRLGDVIERMKVRPKHPEDDVIDNDLILVWGKQKRFITGSDLEGHLFPFSRVSRSFTRCR